MTEIRYVEGLYAMWDELRAKFPNMYLDDCASGGRRIDLEMVMRSVVQTRSDAACAPGRSDWDQSQTYRPESLICPFTPPSVGKSAPTSAAVPPSPVSAPNGTSWTKNFPLSRPAVASAR